MINVAFIFYSHVQLEFLLSFSPYVYLYIWAYAEGRMPLKTKRSTLNFEFQVSLKKSFHKAKILK